jgi:predicted metal-binding protein
MKKASRPVTDSDDKILDLVRGKDGVVTAKIVQPAYVETAGWVRLKCQYGCSGYGKCLVCPPHTPAPEQTRRVLDSYKRAILIQFDRNSDVKATVVELEREFFLAGFWKAFGLGAGPCQLCGKCTLDDKACRHPEEARPAMEACGIDVFSTVRRASLPIEVVRTSRDTPHYYGLLLLD